MGICWGLTLPEVGLLVAAGLGMGLMVWLVGRRLLTPATDTVSANEHSEAPAQPARVERRRSPRRKGAVIAVLLAESQKTTTPETGYIMDRSLEGLCVQTATPRIAGSLLLVRPLAAPPGTPWLEIQVCSCRPGPEGWLLGCRFLRVPPADVRLLFG